MHPVRAAGCDYGESRPIASDSPEDAAKEAIGTTLTMDPGA